VNKEIVAIAIEVLTIFNMVKFLGVYVYLQPLLRFDEAIKNYLWDVKNLLSDTWV
jgi:hypothetical protein